MDRVLTIEMLQKAKDILDTQPVVPPMILYFNDRQSAIEEIKSLVQCDDKIATEVLDTRIKNGSFIVGSNHV